MMLGDIPNRRARPEQTPAIGMARDRRNLHRLAVKRVRYIDVVSVGEGDAVAKMADVIDEEAFNHGARR